MLPDHLVNSYHLETINYGADITYKLKAELEPEKHKKIKNTVAIDICNPVEEINADIVTSKNVAVGHCCSTKSFRINVQLDKSCYSPLDNPDIIMEINNKSSHANIDVIKISLSRMIFLTSNKNQKTIFSQYIGQHKVKGCQKGKICEKDSALMTTLQLAKYQKIIHNTPTIKSNKVECKYSLIFEFESFDCCVKNIDEFEIPIRFSSQIIEIIRPQPAVPSL